MNPQNPAPTSSAIQDSFCSPSPRYQPLKDPLALSPITGLSFAGHLTEWGLPHGRGGRRMPLLLLGKLSEKVLWLYDHPEALPYPQSLTPFGLSTENFHFACSQRPLRRFLPALVDTTYRNIVIDTSEPLRPGDFHTLARWARQSHRRFFLIRPFFLSHKKGNPFARIRINGSLQPHPMRLRWQILKGTPYQVFFTDWSGGHLD